MLLPFGKMQLLMLGILAIVAVGFLLIVGWCSWQLMV
jgi:hypothetical protein